MDKMNPSLPTYLMTETEMSTLSPAWTSTRPAETRLAPEADRFALSRCPSIADEVVVVDERSKLSPSQAVEDRLVALLRNASLPVSHLQIRGFGRGRPAAGRD